MKKPIVLIRLARIGLLLTIFHLSANSQSISYPVVGQSVPSFKLTSVDYYSKKTFETSDAKGKWLILDFWDLGCVSCVQSFPKLNKLQQEFNDQLQLFLIGRMDGVRNKNIKAAFDRFTRNLSLQLPVGYDSTLFKRFKVDGLPHVIMISPEGKVYAITDGSEVTHENIQALVDNRNPVLENKPGPWVPERNRTNWNYLIDDDPGLKGNLTAEFHSALAIYNDEPVIGVQAIEDNIKQGFFQGVGINLPYLFKLAWFGHAHWVHWAPMYNTHSFYPVIEVSDTTRFNTAAKKYYNYVVSLPQDRATANRFMNIMKSDLMNYFGYTGVIETRQVSCWIIKATDAAKKKLVSASVERYVVIDAAGVRGKGLSWNEVVSAIRYYKPDQVPVFDETGIDGNIDIDLSAAMIDMEDVSNALSRQGLTLEKSKRPMKVLVIRDFDLN